MILADQYPQFIEYLLDIRWAHARKITSITQLVGKGHNRRQMAVEAMLLMSSRSSSLPIDIFSQGPEEMPFPMLMEKYSEHAFKLHGFLVELQGYEPGMEQHLINAHKYINISQHFAHSAIASMVVRVPKAVDIPVLTYTEEAVLSGELTTWDTHTPKMFNFPNEFTNYLEFSEDEKNEIGDNNDKRIKLLENKVYANSLDIQCEIMRIDRTLCSDVHSMTERAKRQKTVIPLPAKKD